MSLNSNPDIVEPKKTLLTSKSPTNTRKGRAKGKRRERNKTKSVEDTKEDDDDKQYDTLKNINAFSQVSRYHTETIDSYAKDIDLKDLNIFVGDREILTDANLKLYQGVHYGLIGQNGIGKSSNFYNKFYIIFFYFFFLILFYLCFKIYFILYNIYIYIYTKLTIIPTKFFYT